MRLPEATLVLCAACALPRLSEAFIPAGRLPLMKPSMPLGLTEPRPHELVLRQSSMEPRGGEPLSCTDGEQDAEREREEREREARQAREMEELKQELARGKRKKVTTAVGSVIAAVVLFFYQHLHPVEAVTLLRQMQQDSPAIQSVVTNGRPTVVDFYAEWCENCKEMAPTLRALEGRYKNKVNFVVINGDTPQASDLVDKFRVDGIPHFALISKEGEVRTALIGKIPKKVMEADLDALIAGTDLPYEGYDAFEDEDHYIFRDAPSPPASVI